MLELAGNWPWPRAIHGELLAFLTRQQPRAVIFDLIFSEPDRFRLESDQVLEAALRQTPAYLPLVVTDGTPSRLAELPPPRHPAWAASPTPRPASRCWHRKRWRLMSGAPA